MNDNQRKRDEMVKKLREFTSKNVARTLAVLKADVDDNYENSPKYQSALKAYKDFIEVEGVSKEAYEVVLEYARDLYDRCDKTDKLLDEKADSVIKYLGGGSALAIFGALASLKTDSLLGSILGAVALGLLIPSLIAATRAIYFAILVRRPRSSAGLPSVAWAVNMAHFHKSEEKVNLNVWLVLQPLCEAYRHRTDCKARLVHNAHICYVWAIGMLLIPVVGVLVAFVVCISLGMTTPPPDKKADAGAVVSRVV